MEYLEGTEKGVRIREYIQNPESVFLTTGLIIAEILAKHIKENKDTGLALTAVQSIARVVAFDVELGKQSAEIYVHQRKHKPKFGLVDAHVVAAARINSAKVLVCDNDFVGIPESIVIR